MQTILVSSLGSTPQVITETLWALMNPHLLADPGHRDRAPVVPCCVHIVTTAFMTHRESEIRERILLLYAGLPARQQISGEDIHFDVVKGADGQELHDIRTESENIAYANHMTTLIKRLVDADPENATRIHMSLAGGRKSMSSYDHSAMMYFGRLQDELSHVLVQPTVLEGCPDFWWPGQPEEWVTSRSGKRIWTDTGPSPDGDQEAARVDLVPMPFARLGVRIEGGPLPEALDHALVTSWIEAAVAESDLLIDISDPAEPLIRYGDTQIRLRPVMFAFYAALAVAQKDAWVGVGPFGEGGNHAGWARMADFTDPDSLLARTYSGVWWKLKRTNDEGESALARILDHAPAEKDRGADWVERVDRAVRPMRTNLRKELRKAIGNDYLLGRLLPGEGPRGMGSIGLKIPGRHIVLLGFEEAERGLVKRKTWRAS